MKTIRIVFILATTMVVIGCSPVKVITDQDSSVDFSDYSTYHFLGWQENSDQILSDFDKNRIHESFKKEFDQRGLELVPDGGDMAVSLFIVVDRKTSVTAYTDYYTNRYSGYHRYNRGWGQGYATTTFSEEDYLEGTLVLDVFDGASNDQIWQGVAKGTVTEDPGKREKAIPKKIGALMKRFPLAEKE